MSTAPRTIVTSAASVVSMPRLPSMAEITKRMRDNLPGLWIYNPSPDWVQLEVFGLTHLWACPDLGGATEAHPVTGSPVVCDGRTEVKGRFLDQKDSSGKVIEGQDAPAMVKVLIDPGKYGQLGMVWLPGNSQEEDERLIQASRTVFSSYQGTRDEMIVAKRVEFVANWKKSGLHKGEPVPPPLPAETAAMDRLQQRKRVAQYKYECDVADCPTGYASNDWERFVGHMQSAHKLTPKRSLYDSEVSGLSDKTIGAPVANAQAEPRQAIAEAARAFQQASPGPTEPVEGDEEKPGREEPDEDEAGEEDTPRPRARAAGRSRR